MTSFHRLAPRSDFSTASASTFLFCTPFSRRPAATLSKIDIDGNGFGRWKTMPTTRRTATGSTPLPYRLVPSRSISPLTYAPGMTSCIRLMLRSSVDLPQPDGPMKAVTVRGSTVMETSSTAWNAP